MAGYIGSKTVNLSTTGADIAGDADVSGALDVGGGLTVDNDGSTVLTVDRATSDGTIIDVQKSGSSVGVIGANGSRAYMAGPQNGIKFGNTYASPCTNTGATADNAYDLGGTSGRWQDLYLSGGVYLGGTGAANKLDDVETGTWTPTYSSAAGLANITGFNTVEGKYVKIGDVVHAVAAFSITRTSVETFATGDYIVVEGLPFSGEKIGSSAIFGLIGTGHVYSSLGANANATAFIQLFSTATGFYFYVQQINGTVDTADTLFVNLKYST